MNAESLERENAALKQLIVERAKLDSLAQRYEELAGRHRVALNTVDLSLSEAVVQGKVNSGQLDMVSSQLRDAVSIIVQFRKSLKEDVSGLTVSTASVDAALQGILAALENITVLVSRPSLPVAFPNAKLEREVLDKLNARLDARNFTDVN